MKKTNKLYSTAISISISMFLSACGGGGDANKDDGSGTGSVTVIQQEDDGDDNSGGVTIIDVTPQNGNGVVTVVQPNDDDEADPNVGPGDGMGGMVELPPTFNTIIASTNEIQEVQQVCQARYNEFNEFFIGRNSDTLQAAFETTDNENIPSGIHTYWLIENGQPAANAPTQANVFGGVFEIGNGGGCDVIEFQGAQKPDPDGFIQFFYTGSQSRIRSCLTAPSDAINIEELPWYTVANLDYGLSAIEYELHTPNPQGVGSDSIEGFRQEYQLLYNGSEFVVACPDRESIYVIPGEEPPAVGGFDPDVISVDTWRDFYERAETAMALPVELNEFNRDMQDQYSLNDFDLSVRTQSIGDVSESTDRFRGTEFGEFCWDVNTTNRLEFDRTSSDESYFFNNCQSNSRGLVSGELTIEKEQVGFFATGWETTTETTYGLAVEGGSVGGTSIMLNNTGTTQVTGLTRVDTYTLTAPNFINLPTVSLNARDICTSEAYFDRTRQYDLTAGVELGTFDDFLQLCDGIYVTKLGSIGSDDVIMAVLGPSGNTLNVRYHRFTGDMSISINGGEEFIAVNPMEFSLF